MLSRTTVEHIIKILEQFSLGGAQRGPLPVAGPEQVTALARVPAEGVIRFRDQLAVLIN